jgi:low affinity Fe/Cu permease
MKESVFGLAKSFVPVIALVGFLFSAFFFIDNRYASSEDVKQIEQRLDYKITADQMNDMQNRLWTLEDRYGHNLERANDIVKQEYRKLKSEKDELSKKLDILRK